MRLLLILVFSSFWLSNAFSQSLPSFVQNQFPLPNATGVARNSGIAVRFSPTVELYNARFRLTDRSGTSIQIEQAAVWNDSESVDLVYRPLAALASLTSYTFSVTAPGISWQFSFTTGTMLDTSPPRLVSISPDPATSGVSPFGPFIFRFDKELLSASREAVTATTGTGYSINNVGQALSADRRSIEINLQNPNGVLTVINIALDPAKVRDLAGNAGVGAVSNSRFVTSLFRDAQRFQLLGQYPEPENTAVPTNAIVQLLFNRPLHAPSIQEGGIVLESAGSVIPFQLAYDGRLVRLGNVSLQPNTPYRVRVTTKLLSADGVAMERETAANFRTGAGPDPEPVDGMMTGPQEQRVPVNAAVVIRSARRLPSFAPLLFTNPVAPVAGLPTPSPLQARLLDDGKTLVFTPVEGVWPVWSDVAIDLFGLSDITGEVLQSPVRITTSDLVDTAAPQAIATTPENGAQDVPVSITPRIRLNEPVGLMTPASAIRLTRNGEAVPGRIVFPASLYGDPPTPSIVGFEPANPLDAGTEYQLEFAGVLDRSGNALTSQTVRFRAAGEPAAPGAALKIIESNAESGDIDPGQTIEIRYDGPVQGASTIAVVMAAGASTSHPTQTTVSGGLIRVSPVLPWPSNRNLSLMLYSQDQRGGVFYHSVTFRARASEDRVRPEVVSISPPPGTPVSANQIVRVVFSKPMLDASPMNGLTVWQAELQSPSVYWSDDRTTATIILFPNNIQSSQSVTIAATAALTDLAGNAVKAFTAQYPVVPGSAVKPGDLPEIIASWPRQSSTDKVDVRSPIALYFSRAVDAKRLNETLWVATARGRSGGVWELSADNRLATFRPASSWLPNTLVRLVQVEPVIRLDYGFTFTTAQLPSLLQSIRRTSFVGSHPANAVIDIEFTQDLASGPSPVIVVTGQHVTDTPVPCDEVRLSPRVLRLVPKVPLTVGSFLSIRPRDAFENRLFVSPVPIAPALDLPPARQTVRAPAAESSAVPRSVSIAAAWTQDVNPVSVSEATLRLSAGGKDIPAVISIPASRTVVVATPLEPLPSEQWITVTINGVQDRLGRPYPMDTWSFRTGPQIDTAAPELLFSNAQTPMDPQRPVMLTFNEPLNPADVEIGSGLSSRWELSPDLRTVSYIPSRGWDRGEAVSLSTRRTDLSGNTAMSPDVQFTAGFDADTAPVVLRSVSVRDGQTRVPLASVFSLLFNKPVPGGGLGTVRLFRGTVEVGLSVRRIDGNRVSLRPQNLLDPNTTYRLSITGTETPAAVTFTTGEQLKDPPVSATVRYSSLSAPLALRFSGPVDVTSLMNLTGALTWSDTRGGSGWTLPFPVSVTWSEDGMSAQVTPSRPLTAGVRYTLRLNLLQAADGSAAVTPSTFDFIAVEFVDRTPVKFTIIPADGSTNVPVSVQMQIAFSRVVNAPRVQLYENGIPVAATVGTAVSDGFSLAGIMSVRWNVKPDENYRIVVDPFQDDQGNDIPGSSSSFRTGIAQRPPPLSLLSTSPANGDAGVSPTEPWIFSFNAPLLPFVYLEFPTQSSRAIPFRTATEVDGSKLILRPDPAWPAASTLTVFLSSQTHFGLSTIQDWTGQRLQQPVNVTIRTVAINDPVPPVLESVTPAPGSTIPGATATITLRFSKPVSLGTGALQVFYGSQKADVNGVYSSDFRSATYTLLPPERSRVTIVGTDAIRDNADNRMAPFVLEYPTGEAAPFGAPTATLTEPAQVSEVPRTTNIVVRFDRVMDAPSVLSSLRVTQDGQNVSGSLEVLEDGRSYRFRQMQPFQAGANVKVFILPTAKDPAGLAYRADSPGHLYFFVAANPLTSALQITYRGFGRTAAADEILEVAFSQPLDPASVDDTTVWLRRGNQFVPGTASLRDGRILRFTPRVFLEPGSEYVLTAGSGLRGVAGALFRGQDLAFRAEGFAPVAEVESVSETQVNETQALRVRFTHPVSPLAQVDGMMNVETRHSTDGREVVVIGEGLTDGTLGIELKGRRLKISRGEKPR